jgi:photosystem II stability/assembly factor-like uncharacterized protein
LHIQVAIKHPEDVIHSALLMICRKAASTYLLNRYIRMVYIAHMKRRAFLIPVLVVALAAFAVPYYFDPATTGHAKKNHFTRDNEIENPLDPYDFLFHQRCYPDTSMDIAAYAGVMQGISGQIVSSAARTTSIANWNVEGPANIGGRINCVVSDPNNPLIIYAGCPTAGIFKTTDGGATWNPIFDNQPLLSIGCLAIDPNNSSVIWAGTGDANISGYPFIGNGIFKSTDGGNTWTHMGLTDTRIISKIIIDPNNSNIIYAAAMGLPFVRDNNRGLYKSTNGGTTWSQVLFVSIEAGVIDLLMDPGNTQVLYAATYNCIRNNQEKIYYGPDSKIRKSTDGGNTWTVLNNGLPSYPVSRIGLAMSSQNSNTLFAIIIDSTFSLEGIYKTINGGASWTTVPTFTFDVTVGPNGFGWYFGKIYVNPADDNQLYVPGVEMQTTLDGGNSWQPATPPWWSYIVHADGHWIHFVNNNTLLYATDGGLYSTNDNCQTWNDIQEIPNTQFYRLAINPFDPSMYYGGAQDNGTTSGNAIGGINNWQRVFGGDGFQAIFDNVDPNIFYVETQNGNISFTDDGGFNYYDGTIGIDTSDRRSWDMPYLLDSSVTALICGTYRVYEMPSCPYGAWTPLSGDLTDGIIYDPKFHVISALAQSPLNTDVIYAGTSDGNVWSTINRGIGWNNITDTLPDRYVTSVTASPNIVSNVYVTHSGYKSNDYIPHIHKSTNYGATWTDISGNLPAAAVNALKVMPGNELLLFAATDAGVYVTIDGGVTWNRAGNNMPVMPVYDLAINTTTNKLIAGTFARSIWTIDIPLIISRVPGVASVKPPSIYPNPATQTLNISLPGGKNVTADIYDVRGKKVSSQTLTSFTRLDISELEKGMYIISFRGDGQNYSQKFMKQ